MVTDTHSISQNIDSTVAAIQSRGIQAEVVETGAQALERIQQLIPEGARVMTGGSVTLKQIGLEELLKAQTHPWINLKDEILAETDMVKQGQLRKQSTLADYFLGSVQAITETGELVFASAGGSQLAAYAFSSSNIVWVAGVQKIVPTLEDALRRVREHNLPIEDQRMKGLGFPGSFIGKILIFEREPAQLGRKIHLILVNETVGV
ncbi:MAG: lactate utilization protein [Chloroflexota bacterium]